MTFAIREATAAADPPLEPLVGTAVQKKHVSALSISSLIFSSAFDPVRSS